MHENERATAYWDFPLYAESNLVTANRIDATIVDKGKREVSLIEMSAHGSTTGKSKQRGRQPSMHHFEQG